MTYTRIFLAHPRDTEEEEITRLIDVVQRSEISTPSTVIWSARASFLEFEKEHGKPVNWRRWFDRITGLQPGFGSKPVYDAFVVGPTATVGKATKDIVRECLRKGRPVYRTTPDLKIAKVTKVVTLDEFNFKHGWVVA